MAYPPPPYRRLPPRQPPRWQPRAPVPPAARPVLTPTRPLPSVLPQVPGHIAAPGTQAQARDAALALLEAARAELIDLAYDIALAIWTAKGEVSPTEVWAELFQRATTDAVLAYKLETLDRRWMGAVFRPARGWVQLRTERSGSHKRPVPVWTR